LPSHYIWSHSLNPISLKLDDDSVVNRFSWKVSSTRRKYNRGKLNNSVGEYHPATWIG
jgi:hypothetical protein